MFKEILVSLFKLTTSMYVVWSVVMLVMQAWRERDPWILIDAFFHGIVHAVHVIIVVVPVVFDILFMIITFGVGYVVIDFIKFVVCLC